MSKNVKMYNSCHQNSNSSYGFATLFNCFSSILLLIVCLLFFSLLFFPRLPKSNKKILTEAFSYLSEFFNFLSFIILFNFHFFNSSFSF